MIEKTGLFFGGQRGYVENQFYYSQDVDIPIAVATDQYPVTPEQQQLYILQKSIDREAHYNVSKVFLIKGKLDKAKLANAFERLVERHAILRTYFIAVNGKGYQKIARKINYKKMYKTITNAEDISYVISDWSKPFQAGKPGLFSFGLIEISTVENYIFLSGHYSILDNWSLFILFDELMQLYQGKLLAMPAVTYHDFAAWQECRFYGIDYEKQRRFWHEMLGENLPKLQLPTDYLRPPIRECMGDGVWLNLSVELTEAIRDFAVQRKISLCAFFFAAYTIYLSHMSRQEDLIVGIPFAGRMYRDVVGIPGMFANIHGIRSMPKRDKDFTGFLAEIYDLLEQAKLNQAYPITKLLEELKIEQTADRNPMFDVSFEFLPDSGAKMYGALEAVPFMLPVRTSWFDLSFKVQDFGDHIEFGFIYNCKLFCKSTVETLLHEIEKLLTAIVSQPNRKVAELVQTLQKREAVIHGGGMEHDAGRGALDAATWITMVGERQRLRKIRLNLTKCAKLNKKHIRVEKCKVDERQEDALSSSHISYQAVLLIGVMEYVGIYMFYELFCERDCDLYLIIDSETEEAAKEKLKKTFSYYLGEAFAELCLHSPRLYIVKGAVSKANLGLTSRDYQLLCQRIDLIVNAADVIQLDSQADLYEKNVQSVLNLIELAKNTKGLKAFAHFSPLAIASGYVANKVSVNFSESDMDIGQQLTNYYAETKLQAEKALAKARQEGIAVSIYRIDALLFPPPKGKLPQNIKEMALFELFSAYVKMGVVPRDFTKYRMSRIDDVVRAILLLQESQFAQNGNFHLDSLQRMRLGQILKGKSIHMDLREVSSVDFVELLYRNYGRIGFKGLIETVIAQSDWLLRDMQTQWHIDSERTTSLLNKLGLIWHEIDFGIVDSLIEIALADRICFLSKLSITTDFTRKELLDLAKISRPVLYAPAEVLAWEGEVSDKFMIIWEGFVDSSKTNVIGWENSIGIYKMGDFFGSANLADGVAINSTTLEAVNQDVLILEFAAESIRDFMKGKPEFALRLIQRLHEQLNRLQWLWINAE